MSNYHIGIDLHKAIVQVCVLDEAGLAHEEKRFRVTSTEDGARVLEVRPPGRVRAEEQKDLMFLARHG